MNRPIRLALFGGMGRMGQEIYQIASKESDWDIVAFVDESAHHKLAVPLNQLKSKSPEVVIEFSSPGGLAQAAEWCVENQVPLVSGTTGLSKEQETVIKNASKKVPVFRSANMSFGVNALLKVLREFVKLFPDCDVQVEETHHRHKKDKPSGTALLLQNAMKEAVEGSSQPHFEEPVSLRGGEIFGIHKVYFFGKSEWLCFEHQAQNRGVFAEGALKAAQWLRGKKPGLYSMEDLLNEKSSK